jgi:hypothetical protein
VRRVRAHRRSARLTMPAERTRLRDEWGDIFRNAPIGVLVIGFLLLLVGVGFILGGTMFAVSGRGRGWPVWLVLFGVGPLVIYVALHFVSGRGWAWLTIVVVLLLMLLSAAVRLFTAVVFPVVPLAEIVVSGAIMAYLLRPRVRSVFGR